MLCWVVSLCHIIVSITESWLDSSITDGLIIPTSFTLLNRHDRVSRVDGGALAFIYIGSFILITYVSLLKLVECFELVTDLTSELTDLLFYVVRQLSAVGRDYVNRLYRLFMLFVWYTRNIVIIAGDINLPHIDWSTGVFPSDSIHSLLSFVQIKSVLITMFKANAWQSWCCLM